jgi:hypothetical protein
MDWSDDESDDGKPVQTVQTPATSPVAGTPPTLTTRMLRPPSPTRSSPLRTTQESERTGGSSPFTVRSSGEGEGRSSAGSTRERVGRSGRGRFCSTFRVSNMEVIHFIFPSCICNFSEMNTSSYDVGQHLLRMSSMGEHPGASSRAEAGYTRAPRSRRARPRLKSLQWARQSQPRNLHWRSR